MRAIVMTTLILNERKPKTKAVEPAPEEDPPSSPESFLKKCRWEGLLCKSNGVAIDLSALQVLPHYHATCKQEVHMVMRHNGSFQARNALQARGAHGNASRPQAPPCRGSLPFAVVPPPELETRVAKLK
eukprot:2770454-Amphidinium_carterae.1